MEVIGPTESLKRGRGLQNLSFIYLPYAYNYDSSPMFVRVAAMSCRVSLIFLISSTPSVKGNGTGFTPQDPAIPSPKKTQIKST